VLADELVVLGYCILGALCEYLWGMEFSQGRLF
jgi:hypothetical protein